MIFRNWQQVLDGTKTQTRRPVKEDEYGVSLKLCDYTNFCSVVLRESHRIKWAIGRTYAIQPPGKKAVGRTPPLRDIRRERLGDISQADCIAEGIGSVDWEWGTFWQSIAGPERLSAQEAYQDLWDTIHGKGAWERAKDDDVWVLDWGNQNEQDT